MQKRIIALAGNPNVGKSTIFNALTKLNQHTGNWTGKTVGTASGFFSTKNCEYKIIDLPGTYSLFASSKEEEIARDFIYFGDYSDIICVLDACGLERTLILALQILEFSPKATICVNLVDQATKKSIEIDFDELSLQLCANCIPTSARNKKGLDKLVDTVEKADYHKMPDIAYDNIVESAISKLEDDCERLFPQYPKRWLSLRLLENQKSFETALAEHTQQIDDVKALSKKAKTIRENVNINDEAFRDLIVTATVNRAEHIVQLCVKQNEQKNNLDEKLDKIFTSKHTGIPIMLLMLMFIFWLTIYGANCPSQILSLFFEECNGYISNWLCNINAPQRFTSFLCDGVFSTVGQIVSVMLPPMAIFFPLFTILEDFGYLPRVAFNLDKLFQKANTSGKQSLTMCMGLGCNACGITGCRIIDSQRERSIAILTNSFMPCNGKFPTLIAIVTMFFGTFSQNNFIKSFVFALILSLLILTAIYCTLFCSKLLSSTLFKGKQSHFALELPPYRAPQIAKVIMRSILDRTIFVLLRALIAAIPAGAIIWICANIQIGNVTILAHASEFLDPIAIFFGLDGVILLAFILGFPANEIVFPIIIMAYTASSTPTEMENYTALKDLLVSNGWTTTTAICTLIFTLLHFPCATSCITVYKETKSIPHTLGAFALPTVFGLVLCAIVAHILPIFIG